MKHHIVFIIHQNVLLGFQDLGVVELDFAFEISIVHHYVCGFDLAQLGDTHVSKAFMVTTLDAANFGRKSCYHDVFQVKKGQL